jgi:lysozyme family protein
MLTNNTSFDRAFALLLRHEGGYQCDPDDLGNWTGSKCGEGELRGTKYGLSARSYPNLDIKNLTVADARQICFDDWWVKYALCDLPDPLAVKALDLAFPMGPRPAIECLQRALNGFAPASRELAVDGVLGPATLDLARTLGAPDLLARFEDEAVARFESIAAANPALAKFLPGWRTRALDPP